MRHKILFAILGITLLCGHVSVMAAGATDDAPAPQKQDIRLNPSAMKSNRPWLLDLRSVDCTYEDGWLYISFAENEAWHRLHCATNRPTADMAPVRHMEGIRLLHR